MKDQKVWIDGHEYVDLGLSVNWATMNIGASTPEDYGDYFAWGETTPKNTYDMATYKWSNSVTSALTKYNTDPIIGIVDNITTLELLDDAANASWHGSWRMPTAAELTELMAKCTWTWTTQNGKNGYEVTGPNGNSIFLPAAGYYDENSLNEAGNAANYWSSSLETTHPNNGWYMSFGSKGVNMCDGVRCYGRSVRAVCKKTYIQPNISLSDTLLQMQPGESVQLTVTVEPSDAGIVTWTSSDESVATVANGLVTAIAEGTATIMAEVAGAKATDGSNVKATCKITVSRPIQLIESITLLADSLILFMGETQTLTAMVYPSDATYKSLTWSSSETSVVTVDGDRVVTAVGEGTAIITCESMDGSGVKTICYVLVKTNNNGHEYVDLGLSVKWATMNVGAHFIEGYGDYFAWGETLPQDNYWWSTYSWCNGSDVTLTKYCTDNNYGTLDKKTVLELVDDAAHVNWGGSWRMPTYDELNELKEKCTWTWTSLNGVYGRKVTGPSGNFIFLPAAGYRQDASRKEAGDKGYYWSSSLNEYYPISARDVRFSSKGFNTGDYYRALGRSVRAVCP
ncbi:MAG: Ig-like domain-containing protein [Bacteroidaceae bacterium]|nr:Ig-like domain-containing protein [Bacteroidaceae bacterium]